MENDRAETGSEGLSVIFKNLEIDPESSAAYQTKLTALGLKDVKALRIEALTSFLQEKVGVKPELLDRIMRKIHEIEAQDVLDYAPHSYRAARSIPPVCLNTSFLSKENVVILRQIGHGASGRVFKALFVPTLTLIVIKYIEIKVAIEQRLVAQELKSLYEVALRDHIGGDADQESEGLETDTTTSAEAKDAMDSQAAHSPYIIGFYGAVSWSLTSLTSVLVELINRRSP